MPLALTSSRIAILRDHVAAEDWIRVRVWGGDDRSASPTTTFIAGLAKQ